MWRAVTARFFDIDHGERLWHVFWETGVLQPTDLHGTARVTVWVN